MDAKSIILDLKTSGLTSRQIAQMAGITDPAVHYIIKGQTKMVHRQTLFGLLKVHAAALKVAQKRLEATTHDITAPSEPLPSAESQPVPPGA